MTWSNQIPIAGGLASLGFQSAESCSLLTCDLRLGLGHLVLLADVALQIIQNVVVLVILRQTRAFFLRELLALDCHGVGAVRGGPSSHALGLALVELVKELRRLIHPLLAFFVIVSLFISFIHFIELCFIRLLLIIIRSTSSKASFEALNALHSVFIYSVLSAYDSERTLVDYQTLTVWLQLSRDDTLVFIFLDELGVGECAVWVLYTRHLPRIG